MYSKIDREIVNYLNNLVNSKDDYLDFKGISMDYSTHKYHDYPATMIPKLPDLFINAVQSSVDIHNVYDPFMGSGTTLVEATRHELNSTGVDLNPLAVLMSRVKNRVLNQKKLEKYRNEIYKLYSNNKEDYVKGKLTLKLPTFKKIDYWFKDYVILDLQILRSAIFSIHEEEYREFFLIPFSSTVRYVSNTRNGEFKMYRMAPKSLEKWHPDVFSKFKELADKNVYLNSLLSKHEVQTNALLGSSKSLPNINSNSFDLLITSPPYGDSRTTVAYGQFSRTSLQWLDLDVEPADEVPKLDRKLLGGKVVKDNSTVLPSVTLNETLKEIGEQDEKRAREVKQFYDDLFVVLKECKRVMKPGSYQFWVTANRTVKGIQIPTDKIITELFESINVIKLVSYTRNIPNKRMPAKNSPTNKKGKTNSTMKQENIVLYKTLKNNE